MGTRPRDLAVAALAVLLAFGGTAGCASTGSQGASLAVNATFPSGTTMDRIHRAQKITIGSKFDQPGFGLKGLDGKLAGFDVELGKIIAGELGIAENGIEWVESTSKVREEYLEQGKVDVVVATYTINDARKKRVDFAGPYYVAGQQIMTRKDETAITGPESFKAGTGKVCSATGSTSSLIIEPYLRDKASQLVLFDAYSSCADALRTRQVDAVATDNVILNGFVAAAPDTFKLVGERFTDERYGIGVKKGDTAFREWLNTLLERIVSDGRYGEAWRATLGRMEPDPPAPPAVDRY